MWNVEIWYLRIWNRQRERYRKIKRHREIFFRYFTFFDETQLIGYKEESRKKSLVAGLIYIDNYEEVLENMEEVRQSLLLALVERKIMKYMQGLDAIIKGFEKDKFLFVFEEEKLEQLMESKFFDS